MPKYSTGKYAQRISDRSGLAFPYNEMVQEWNGSWVHESEYEMKHPQLEPNYHPTDPQSLKYAKPQKVSAQVLLGINMFAGNIFEATGMMPNDGNKELLAKMQLGSVTVTIS